MEYQSFGIAVNKKVPWNCNHNQLIVMHHEKYRKKEKLHIFINFINTMTYSGYGTRRSYLDSLIDFEFIENVEVSYLEVRSLLIPWYYRKELRKITPFQFSLIVITTIVCFLHFNHSIWYWYGLYLFKEHFNGHKYFQLVVYATVIIFCPLDATKARFKDRCLLESEGTGAYPVKSGNNKYFILLHPLNKGWSKIYQVYRSKIHRVC